MPPTVLDPASENGQNLRCLRYAKLSSAALSSAFITQKPFTLTSNDSLNEIYDVSTRHGQPIFEDSDWFVDDSYNTFTALQPSSVFALHGPITLFANADHATWNGHPTTLHQMPVDRSLHLLYICTEPLKGHVGEIFYVVRTTY